MAQATCSMCECDLKTDETVLTEDGYAVCKSCGFANSANESRGEALLVIACLMRDHGITLGDVRELLDDPDHREPRVIEQALMQGRSFARFTFVLPATAPSCPLEYGATLHLVVDPLRRPLDGQTWTEDERRLAERHRAAVVMTFADSDCVETEWYESPEMAREHYEGVIADPEA